ncbi:hypothetical protein F2P44_21455 [Massilia sp. CCM 8695]|uniref:Tail fiber protein n=1 Tax=Massilia frigida TaxID=2609281 RepID=A0ABX0NBZ1_9BURK|nr:hypothetical protein [Massilia frigida]NHZ81823.1 hypothetical protein [Massilia frigida]
MTPIPPLDRTSATFRAEVDTYFGTRIPLFTTEINALATDLTTKQGLASDAAISANAAKTAAETARDNALNYKNNAFTAADSSENYKNQARDFSIAAAGSALTASSAVAFVDSNSIAKGSVDASKQVRFECDTLIPTGTVIPLTVPATGGTIALLSDTDLRPKSYYDAGAAVALDYASGVHQRWAPGTGSKTLTISNWPAAGTHAELMIEGVNLGQATITWPAYINWIRYDGTYTTAFSYAGATLQTGGTDFIILWTRTGSTQVFGRIVR